MKNRFFAIVAVLSILFSLGACCLEHEWAPANCVSAKTCIKCGETEGEALGHKWNDASCTSPKTCSVCGKKEGDPIGHKTGEWVKADEALIGGKEYCKCSVCGEIIEERFEKKEAKSKLDLFSSGGLALSCNDFKKRLVSYLPEGTVVCTENRNNDDVWFNDGSTFSVIDIYSGMPSRYIRVWYADSEGFSGSEPYEEHIDAYFDTTDDFIDIAPAFFEAVDSEFVKTEKFKNAVSSLELSMKELKSSGKEYSLKMTNGYFICTYTQPYNILGEWHPGYYGIRFISDKFYHKIYG